jgi:vitamin B12 transporter
MDRIHRSRYALALILLLVAGGITAQEPEADQTDQPLPELPETTVVGQPDTGPAVPSGAQTVITPTRTETDTSRVGSSLTVITREQIEQSGQTSVLEVLRSVPGLHVVQSGPPGGFTSVFMRGGNSQHTKVLLDGIPLNDPSNAGRSFDFSTLTIDNIERIEVLRGPQSTLYGSDAIGGVINIITIRGEGPLGVRASALGGAYGTHREGAAVSGGNCEWHYAFAGSFLDTDGFSSAAERLGNTEDDGYRNGTLSGRFGWTPSDLVDVDYVFRYTDAAAEVDDFSFVTGLPFDNPRRENLTQQFFQRVELTSVVWDGIIESIVGFNLADYERFDTDAEPFLDPLFLGQTRKVDWQGNVLLLEDNIFTVGVDYYQEEASTTSIPELAQNNGSIYIQDQIGLGDRWFTTAGFRWDDHSAAGTADTYRFTTVYQLWETGTAFRGTLGTGFRAPSLAENLFPFGNPNLQPETSRGWDYGIEQRFFNDRLVVTATYFRNDFRNLIIFDFATFLLENVGRAKAHGVELVGAWGVNCCTDLVATYTRTDTEDLATGLPLLRRPRDKATLGILRKVCCGRGRVGADLLYVGERLDTRNRTLDDYVTVNLNATYDWRCNCQLFGRIDNLFDEDYEEVAGFGVAGISAYGGVNVTW